MLETTVLTNNLLKGVMTDAVVARTGTDADLLLTNGIYQNSGTMKNLPSGAYNYGILTVMGSTYFIEQHYYPHNVRNGIGFYRRMYYDNHWNGWIGIPYQSLT